MDEAENHIDDWEHKEAKSNHAEQQEEQRQNHGYGEHFDACQIGGGGEEWVKR